MACGMCFDCLGTKHTVSGEVGNTFKRVAKFGDVEQWGRTYSLTGRFECFKTLCKSALHIPYKPTVYLIKGIVFLFFLTPWNFIFRSNDEGKRSWDIAKHAFACIIVTPFTKLFTVVQCAFGILHPSAYYTGHGDDRVHLFVEICNIFSRIIAPLPDNYSRFDSCYGRMWCVVNFGKHLAAMIILPVIYLVKGCVEIFFILPLEMALCEQWATRHYWSGLNSFGYVIVAPVKHGILLVRSAIGVIHSGAYYKEAPFELPGDRTSNDTPASTPSSAGGNGRSNTLTNVHVIIDATKG